MADNCELSSYGELADLIENLPLVLREHRRAHRLSLRAAGEQVGVSASTLMRFESGGTGIATDGLVQLLRWLAGPSQPTTDETGRPDA